MEAFFLAVRRVATEVAVLRFATFLPAFFAAPFFFGVAGFDFARGAFFAAFLATLATFFLDLALVAGRFFVVLEEVLAAMKIPEKV